MAGERLGAEDEKPESSKPKIELKPTLVSFGSGKYNPKDGSWSSPLNITKFKLSMDPGDLHIGFEGNETYDKIGFGVKVPVLKELDLRGGFNYDGIVHDVSASFSERWAGYGGLQIRPIDGFRFTGLVGEYKQKPLYLLASGIEKSDGKIIFGLDAGYLKKEDTETYQLAGWLCFKEIFGEKDFLFGIGKADPSGKNQKVLNGVSYLGREGELSIRTTSKVNFDTKSQAHEMIVATNSRKGVFDLQAARDFIEDPIDNQPIRNPLRAIESTNPPLNLRGKGSDVIEFSGKAGYIVESGKMTVNGEALVYPIKEIFFGSAGSYGLDSYSNRAVGVLGTEVGIGKYVNLVLRGEAGQSSSIDPKEGRRVMPDAGVIGRVQINF